MLPHQDSLRVRKAAGGEQHGVGGLGDVSQPVLWVSVWSWGPRDRENP